MHHEDTQCIIISLWHSSNASEVCLVNEEQCQVAGKHQTMPNNFRHDSARHFSEMTYYVWSGTFNSSQSVSMQAAAIYSHHRTYYYYSAESRYCTLFSKIVLQFCGINFNFTVISTSAMTYIITQHNRAKCNLS